MFLRSNFLRNLKIKSKIQKKFTIFILGHSGPFSPLLKKRNGHREVPTTGRDLQIYINYLTPASFHAVPLVLENIHSFGRSLNNNILDKNGSREGPRRGSNLKIYINHLTITIFHPIFLEVRECSFAREGLEDLGLFLLFPPFSQPTHRCKYYCYYWLHF